MVCADSGYLYLFRSAVSDSEERTEEKEELRKKKVIRQITQR